MSERNDGGSAFPRITTHIYERDGVQTALGGNNGMSLRDWFATHAPKKIPDWFMANQGTKEERYFMWRWYYAGAMLKEREK